jgi:hypothetical protein
MSMTVLKEALNEWPIQNPRQLLRGLAQYAQKFSVEEKDYVEVAVFLNTGHTLTGRIAGIIEENEESYIQLYVGELINPSVAYFQLNTVIGLQIFSPLSLGIEALRVSAWPPRKGAVPTRLELKRSLDQANQQLKEAGIAIGVDSDWASFGESAEEQFTLADSFSLVQKSLQAIWAQADGKDALRKISQVVLAHSIDAKESKILAEKADKIVKLRYDFRRPLPKSFESDLTKKLESVL